MIIWGIAALLGIIALCVGIAQGNHNLIGAGVAGAFASLIMMNHYR